MWLIIDFSPQFSLIIYNLSKSRKTIIFWWQKIMVLIGKRRRIRRKRRRRNRECVYRYNPLSHVNLCFWITVVWFHFRAFHLWKKWQEIKPKMVAEEKRIKLNEWIVMMRNKLNFFNLICNAIIRKFNHPKSVWVRIK